MRTISLFFLASVFSTGCIISASSGDDIDDRFCGNGILEAGESCDDGNGINGDGCSSVCTSEGGGAKVTASWEFKNFPNTTVGCPAGFPTIAHYNLPTAGGQPIIDLYDCVDGSNFTDPLPPAEYQTWLESTDDSGGNVYAQSVSAIVDLTSQDASFSAAIFNDAGYFLFGWNLTAASNGAAVSCAQAQADGVEIISTVTGGSQAITDQFNCEDGSAITAALLAGSYTISIDAFQDGAGSLGAPVNRANQIIGDRNQVTDLGTVTLPIDGL